MSLAVVGISLFVVLLAGGLRWVWHFAFPVCFILVAVQWPYRIEHGLTQGLMRVVSALTVELLGWFNVPAFQHGNLIEVSTGVVGVSEACSGIRSFQSSLMAALFMGELYRLRLLPRGVLVLCSLSLGFCFNIVRTLLLSWQANAHGLSAIDRWHDPAGMTIAVACLLSVWAIAVLFQSRWRVASDLVLATKQGGDGSASGLQPLLRRYLFAVGCWAILCLVATEVWYRSHDIKDSGVFHWSVVLPENNPTYEKVELPPRTVKTLAFDFGLTGRWQEQDGANWTLDFFRWNPHSMQSVISARLHRPEVCLPAAGLRQISKSALDYFEAGPLQIPFHKYIFETGGQQLYVFFSLWQDGNEQTGMRTLDKGDRIQWVLAGRRGLGQQTLEIICTGYPDMAAAEKVVREELPGLIRIESRPVGTTDRGRGRL